MHIDVLNVTNLYLSVTLLHTLMPCETPWFNILKLLDDHSHHSLLLVTNYIEEKKRLEAVSLYVIRYGWSQSECPAGGEQMTFNLWSLWVKMNTDVKDKKMI